MYNFYDLPIKDQIKLKKQGVTNELIQCLNSNPIPEVGFDDFEEVLAFWDGIRDGNYRWIVRLKRKYYAKFLYIFGHKEWDWEDENSKISYKFETKAMGAITSEREPFVSNALFNQLVSKVER